MATATTPRTPLSKLNDKPTHFSDCCAGISKPLIEALVKRLPQKPALTLSVGCGSGLLEAYLLEATHDQLDLYGVEVPPCINRHLPEGRVLRVPCTASMHPEAMLASSLIFVYPRMPSLVARYIDAFIDGALESMVWLGHRNDFPEVEQLFMAAFQTLELIEGPGIEPYELLAIVSRPRQRPLLDMMARHVTPTEDKDRTTASSLPTLTSEQLDVWEHAALLYHGYEWQAAADDFESLANTIVLLEECTCCLLNAGMIRTRLGDYIEASVLLNQAAMLGSSLAITPFLLGLVEYELGNIIKAEACFEVCSRFIHDDRVNYSELGLDFVLDCRAVRWNMAVAHTGYRRSPQEIPLRMMGLPADCIFEAPPRRRRSRSTSTIDDDGLLEQFRRLKDLPASIAHDGRQSRTLSATTLMTTRFPGSQCYLGTSQDPRGSVAGHGKEASQEKQAPPSYAHGMSPLAGDQCRATMPFFDISPTYNSWKDRRKTPFTPRDARVHYESTRELARFIRQRTLTPREARAVYGSTRELAKFIRHEGHDSVVSVNITRKPVSHRDCFISLPTDGGKHDTDVGCAKPWSTVIRRLSSDEIFRHSVLVKDPREQASIRRHSSTGSQYGDIVRGSSSSDNPMSSVITKELGSRHERDDEHQEQPDAEPLETLPATAFDPKASTTRPRQSSQIVTFEDARNQLHRQGWSCRPFGKIHTPASSSSSFFTESMLTAERADRAQQEAIRVLTGSARPREKGKTVEMAWRVQSLSDATSHDEILDQIGGAQDERPHSSPSTVSSSLIFGFGRHR